MNFFPGEYDAGALSASTRGETTQRLSAPLNHFKILNADVSCKYIFLNDKKLKKIKRLGVE
jgi:hypothetical protein